MTAHFDDALKLALRKLKRKDLFEHEIRLALAKEDAQTSDEVVRWLKEHGCLNDRRAAESAYKALEGKRAVARSRIEERLLERGAPTEIVELVRPEVDEAATALTLLSGRYDREEKNRAKAARFLCSRGYDEELVAQTLEQFFGEPTVQEWAGEYA